MQGFLCFMGEMICEDALFTFRRFYGIIKCISQKEGYLYDRKNDK